MRGDGRLSYGDLDLDSVVFGINLIGLLADAVNPEE